MSWLAVVWEPDAGAVASAGAVARPALADQGVYAAGDPFALLLAGEGSPVAPARLGARVWAWTVEPRPIRVAPEPCPVTMVALTRRRADLTRDEFARHWTERHAPLALRRHVGLADYRQHVVLRALTAGSDEVDGVAMLGFPSRTDFETRFYDSEEGKAEIRADVARFIAARGRETTLVGPPGTGATPG